jgi:hypothetical protein
VTGAGKSASQISDNRNATGTDLEMAEHKLGTMDITEQEKTFHGFIKFTIRTLYVIFAIVVILMIFGA